MSSQAGPPTKDCKYCGNPMPVAAVYCTKCENFQKGGWGSVRFAKEVLPMLVALVAVAGALTPPIVGMFHRADSNLVVSEVHSTRISVTNLGEAPGVVSSIRVQWGLDDMPSIAGSGGLSPVNQLEDPVVRPGETRWFDLLLPAAAAQRIDFSKLTESFEMPCEIVVETTSARQDRRSERFSQRTCGVMLNAMGGLTRLAEPATVQP